MSNLPQNFAQWFEKRGWQARDHQLAMAKHAQEGTSALLIAPTGGGKTLAGFLGPLLDLAANPKLAGIHTIYVSPLKALAVDIARNLEAPIHEMGLAIQVETRTGDTPHSRRKRQRENPPHILITTPEQISLLLSDPHAEKLFANLRYLILDELHALVSSKRGALLNLAMARLQKLAPQHVRLGLSATVKSPETLSQWLVPQPGQAQILFGSKGARPEIQILQSAERVPWSGHSARYAIEEIYAAIMASRMALIFVNTRSQAEMIFQELWHANEAALPIALHHGSLDVSQRRKVEAAMAEARLRAVVCTSTLDLGIDWGDVDLVVQIGAPKGSSRLLQRIGRANHRLEEASRALLVPSNRFEVLECEAARMAASEGAQDADQLSLKKLDCLAQHILGLACSSPLDTESLYAEILTSFAYQSLTRPEFDRVLAFVATGGYALKSYERYAKLKPMPDGRLRLSHPRIAQSWRLNMGTIIEEQMLKVRLIAKRRRQSKLGPGGKILGEVEEYFAEQLTPGDTFIFAGQFLRFEAIEELSCLVTRSTAPEPKIPAYAGGKFPLSTYLAERVRSILSKPQSWSHLPQQVREWLSLQKHKSLLPGAQDLLVETFPRAGKSYLVCYPFEGRLAHQTLGMLLTRRLERHGLGPMGFVANEYALAIWAVRDLSLAIANQSLSLAELFAQDMMGDDLDAWLQGSALMKRTFRSCAMISGLIERRQPGKEKTGRQMTISTDLIYDVLRSHEPDHILLQAAWDDAAEGLIDARRLGQLLARIEGRIKHKALQQISPLAVPIMLEIGKEPIYGEAQDILLEQAASALFAEAQT